MCGGVRVCAAQRGPPKPRNKKGAKEIDDKKAFSTTVALGKVRRPFGALVEGNGHSAAELGERSTKLRGYGFPEGDCDPLPPLSLELPRVSLAPFGRKTPGALVE